MPDPKQLSLNILLSVLIPLPLALIANRFDTFGRFELFVAFFTGPIYVFFVVSTALANAALSPASIDPTYLQMSVILVVSILARLGVDLWLNHLLRNSHKAFSLVATVAISLCFMFIGCMYIGGSQQ